MSTDKIRGDYDALAQIAKTFGNQASNTQQTLNQVLSGSKPPKPVVPKPPKPGK